MSNNKGFGNKEIMIVILIVVALMAVFLYKTSNLDKEGNVDLKKFKAQANVFLADARRLRDDVGKFEDLVYLSDALEQNYTKNLENPFKSGELCDIYESKLVMRNNIEFFYFKCGEYVIYNQRAASGEWDIYKASEWSETPVDGGQTTTFYNIEVDGKEVFSKYSTEKEFLISYNGLTKDNAARISDVQSGYKLMKKTYYRSFDLVDQI